MCLFWVRICLEIQGHGRLLLAILSERISLRSWLSDFYRKGYSVYSLVDDLAIGGQTLLSKCKSLYLPAPAINATPPPPLLDLVSYGSLILCHDGVMPSGQNRRYRYLKSYFFIAILDVLQIPKMRSYAIAYYGMLGVFICVFFAHMDAFDPIFTCFKVG